MRIVYADRYEFDLPGHIWPTSKYRRLAERLRADPSCRGSRFVEPAAATWDELALVHGAAYLDAMRTHQLTPEQIATLELPWTAALADGFRLMVGGTCLAASAALEDGRALHIGGGLHHAFANHGEGFCPFNDVAVAIRVLQRDGAIGRAAILDADVHHGNGTAMIFERDPGVFTCSLHQQHNYPMFKPRSDLDVGFEDGAGDDRYLTSLAASLPCVFETGPDLLFYLAGADPYEHDRLGGLALTKAGLRERDRVVVERATAAGVPLAVVLAGGYATEVEDTVDIHAATARVLGAGL
ncbi:MAG TPA: histone deacetylase [Vicinamibacterales bacterium]|nr:histone deacetylase [Vicinamibacterales bacterium]